MGNAVPTETCYIGWTQRTARGFALVSLCTPAPSAPSSSVVPPPLDDPRSYSALNIIASLLLLLLLKCKYLTDIVTKKRCRSTLHYQ